jgi:gamma-glutamylputrescine oxidase
MVDGATDGRGRPVWETGGWSPLPSLEGRIEAEVCVVGLGGSGLSALDELRRIGVRAVGVDRGMVAGGAAGRNGGFLLAGMYNFHHDAVSRFGRARATAIYRLTLAEIGVIAAQSPGSVNLCGSLRIAASPEEEADCEAQLEAMAADGLPAERYSGAEGTGLLIPTDGAFDPLLRCRSLARSLLSAGTPLFERSEVTAIEQGLVTTSAGEVRCRAVIVAVDGGLEVILPELVGRVRSARLQMLATAPLPEHRFHRPVYRRWGLDYWQQLRDGSLALGGFRDLGGEAEWTTDAAPSDTVQRALERFLREELRVTSHIERRWGATVGFSENGLPVLAEVRPDVWAVGAYSGTGNVLGAVCGRAAAGLVALGESPLSVAGEA